MSYNESLPTDRDKIRALLGDTSNDAATELVADNHINVALSLYAFNGAVAFLATELAARFAQKPGSVSLPGGLSVSWADRVRTWLALAAQMRAGGVVAGGAFAVQPTRNDGYAQAAEAG